MRDLLGPERERVRAAIKVAAKEFQAEGKWGTAYTVSRLAENQEALDRIALILSQTNRGGSNGRRLG